MTKEIAAGIAEKKRAIEEALAGFLRRREDEAPPLLLEAMRHGLLTGGKRLRPLILWAAAEALEPKIRREDVLPFACALEMIHAYSLIHDDLPSMDNDDLRRGQPSCHKKFGEAAAILAGDALLNRAYEIMSDEAAESIDKQGGLTKVLRAARASREIAAAAGVFGMVGGQVLDMLSEGAGEWTHEILNQIHEKKTGALFRAAVLAGACLAGAERAVLCRFDGLSLKLGRCFQTMDDIFDVISTAEERGKNPGGDANRKKLTYVSLHGLDAAKADYARLRAEAVSGFEAEFGRDSEAAAIMAEALKEL
ncbi:MAG: polyprenyl synthetase family protein [Clostridiales bacterium]|jgi:geranylgeranyl diphosphate synthase type II|nr:polyprenyl synthetase family protein [Clostridiales bacterium]